MDLDRLEHWAIINSMNFNKLKCWILHREQSNTRHKYKWGEAGEEPCRKGPGGVG